MKVRADKSLTYAEMLRVGKLAADCGAKYLSVSFFPDCGRLKRDLHDGCMLEVTDVETAADYKSLIAAGAERIGTSHAEEIYAELLREAENYSLAVNFAESITVSRPSSAVSEQGGSGTSGKQEEPAKAESEKGKSAEIPENGNGRTAAGRRKNRLRRKYPRKMTGPKKCRKRNRRKGFRKKMRRKNSLCAVRKIRKQLRARNNCPYSVLRWARDSGKFLCVAGPRNTKGKEKGKAGRTECGNSERKSGKAGKSAWRDRNQTGQRRLRRHLTPEPPPCLSFLLARGKRTFVFSRPGFRLIERVENSYTIPYG